MLKEIGSPPKIPRCKTICYSLLTVGCIAVIAIGVYYLVQAYRSEHRTQIKSFEDQIEYWNLTAYDVFAGLVITSPLPNSELVFKQLRVDDWVSSSVELEPYEPLQYHNESFLIPDYTQFTNSTSDDLNEAKSYQSFTFIVANSTSMETFEVTDILVYWIQGTSRPEGNCINSIWDEADKTCYDHYTLSELCFVIDENRLLPIDSYEMGCHGVRRETMRLINFNRNQTLTHVVVRSVSDPYIYGVLHNIIKFDRKSNTYITAAIALLFGASFVLSITIGFLLRKRRSPAPQDQCDMNEA